MRNAFIKSLIEEARKDESIWLLNGDIGYSVLEGFATEFPNRYLNVGVAEQNMVGVAAGLALAGKRVFTYTIGNFSFMRCLEQIRNDVCYHNLNVTIVAVGGGFAYGAMGYTHHAIEDIAMLRVLPNMKVTAPGDPVETTLAVKEICKAQGPSYLRLGRGGEVVVHQNPPAFALGKAIAMRAPAAATIISSAATLDIAEAAAKELNAGLISMPSLTPFDKDAVLAASKQSKLLVTVEEHGAGGLSSLVAETLMASDANVKLRCLYATKPPPAAAGDRAALRDLQGITTENIIATVKKELA